MHLLELAKTAWNATISASANPSSNNAILDDRIQVARKQAEVFLALAFQVLTVLGDEGDNGGPMEEIAFLGELLSSEKENVL